MLNTAAAASSVVYACEQLSSHLLLHPWLCCCSWVHVDQPVLLLEPARNTYGHDIPKDMQPGSRYRAILADRPRLGAYASVSTWRCLQDSVACCIEKL
jgi:hypothetical protein